MPIGQKLRVVSCCNISFTQPVLYVSISEVLILSKYSTKYPKLSSSLSVQVLNDKYEYFRIQELLYLCEYLRKCTQVSDTSGALQHWPRVRPQ